MPGARDQRRLFELLAAGNHSDARPSAIVSSSSTGRSRWSSSPSSWTERPITEPRASEKRDLRRDAALARLGWLTVRYSHPRLHGDAGGVIEELADKTQGG
jgi:hypothetical protein